VKKKKDDRLGSDPFDSLLPHISDSRKKKDADINNDDAADKNVDNSTNSSINDDKNINNDVAVNVSNDVDEIVNNDVNINKNNYKVDDVNNNSTVNIVDDVNNDVADVIYGNNDIASDVAVGNDVAVSTHDTFKISKKTPKSAHYTRATFYLRPDQLRTINRLHKDSGRDKSELVRMAVDILIKRATVE